MRRTPLKILIAEDDDTSRQALVELLASEGHEPVAVANGKDAVERLSSVRPDLVILDYRLPDMTGLEILARALQSCEGTPPPALLVTGHQLSPAAQVAADELGVRIFSKPVSPTDLLFTVQTAAREA